MGSACSETSLKTSLDDQPKRDSVRFLDNSQKPGPGSRRLMNHPGQGVPVLPRHDSTIEKNVPRS